MKDKIDDIIYLADDHELDPNSKATLKQVEARSPLARETKAHLSSLRSQIQGIEFPEPSEHFVRATMDRISAPSASRRMLEMFHSFGRPLEWSFASVILLLGIFYTSAAGTDLDTTFSTESLLLSQIDDKVLFEALEENSDEALSEFLISDFNDGYSL